MIITQTHSRYLYTPRDPAMSNLSGDPFHLFHLLYTAPNKVFHWHAQVVSGLRQELPFHQMFSEFKGRDHGWVWANAGANRAKSQLKLSLILVNVMARLFSGEVCLTVLWLNLWGLHKLPLIGSSASGFPFYI